MSGREKETSNLPSQAVVFGASVDDYHRSTVEQAVHELLDRCLEGGRVLGRGMTVLVKPNMLSDRPPEEAVTTHPAVLEAVIRYVQGRGARAVIGDSPPQLRGPLRRYWQKTGFLDVAERTGAELARFETDGVTEVGTNGLRFFVSRWVTERAHLVINVPKLKTHNLTLFSGAVKNMFGCLPGGEKANWHARAPHPEDFARVLVELYRLTEPTVTLMDGIDAMVGNGPANGEVVRTGVLLASRDGVAVDLAAASALGFHPLEIDTNRIAIESGLTSAEFERVDVGAPLAPFPLGRFPLPSNRMLRRVPRPIFRFFGGQIWIHPGVDVRQCSGCGICASHCPMGAITMDRHPRFEYERCIDCWCCAESCPENAITIRRSWLARLVT